MEESHAMLRALFVRLGAKMDSHLGELTAACRGEDTVSPTWPSDDISILIEGGDQNRALRNGTPPDCSEPRDEIPSLLEGKQLSKSQSEAEAAHLLQLVRHRDLGSQNNSHVYPVPSDTNLYLDRPLAPVHHGGLNPRSIPEDHGHLYSATHQGSPDCTCDTQLRGMLLLSVLGLWTAMQFDGWLRLGVG